MAYSINEAAQILDSIVKSNIYNKKKGISNRNLAVEFIGEHGIGKSQFVEEYAKKKGYSFIKRELAQITDETSLFGYPRKVYRIKKESKVIETTPEGKKEKVVLNNRKVEIEQLQQYLADGWTQVSINPELSYATPEWVNELAKTDNSILLLDEYKRSLPHIQQACMNLILDGKYANWSLPPNCTIVLCNNPTDGNYNVLSFDAAGMDRMLSYQVVGNIESWVDYATEHNIPEPCINFLYKTDEARDKKDTPSYRKWSMFFHGIAMFDLKDKNDLTTVHRIGVGSVGESMTRLFLLFIDNNLDMIPSLKWIFDPKNNEKMVLDKLTECIYSTDSNGSKIIRSDIKGLLGLRLKSYFRNPKITDDEVNRFSNILDKEIIHKDSLMDVLMDISKPTHPCKNLLSRITSKKYVMDLLMSKQSII